MSENDIDVGAIEKVDLDPNIKIIYDELISFKKELESNEATRQSNETERVANEASRVNAEEARTEAEATRVDNETSRLSAETARQSAETARNEAETNREDAERLRAEAETDRINAEQSRADAEQLRVSAENERVTAENARAEAEANRENTISKLREDLDNNTKSDGRTQRSLSALWDLNKGISYRFEEDKEKAYTKTVPSGAKLGAVNKIGGRMIVYNQLVDPSKRKDIDFDEQTKHFKYSDWTDISGNKYITVGMNNIGGHKYYIYATDKVRFSFLYLYGDSFSVALTKPNDSETEIKQIITATNSGINNLYFNRYQAKPENVSYFDGCINLIDLTKMFGEGNEPSTPEEFEAMFPNDYYPYNEGTLMSMSVNEVEEVGKNIFKCEHFSCFGLDGTNKPTLNNSYGTSINSTEPSNSVTVTQLEVKDTNNVSSYTNGCFCVSFEPFILNEEYVFSFDITPSNKLISSPKIMVLNNGDGNCGSSIINAQSLQIGTKSKLFFTLNANNKKVKYIEIRISGISGVFENFQIEEGSVNTAYTPYHEATYPIPQAILDLDGYGWGVGNVSNYVDYENKKFYKYVNRVDLSTMDFVYTSYGDGNSLYGFRSPLPNGIKKDEDAYSKKNNLLCSKYPDTPWQDAYRGMDKTISQLSQSIQINDSTFSDADSFKESLNGVYLYYELTAPIVTDISDIIEDAFQEPINVESGGSLTFKNTNGDGYKLAVPSDIQYTVKLSEVNS